MAQVDHIIDPKDITPGLPAADDVFIYRDPSEEDPAEALKTATAKGIVTAGSNQFPAATDLSPSDLLLLQDVSDQNEPYKKATVSDIGDTVINEYDLANKTYADAKINDTTASPETAYSSEKTESFVHDYVKKNTAKSENFSTAQWNAINSGITEEIVRNIGTVAVVVSKTEPKSALLWVKI